MIAPTRTKPRTTPSMKPNEPKAGNHGRKALHVAKNPGDSRAIPFATIRPAAIATNAAGSHHLTSNGALPHGPYHPGPIATGAEGIDAGADPKAPTATGAEATGATGAGAGTAW